MSGSNAAKESEPPRDSVDPVLLDRLVDGELAEAERRKLLLSLDHQPSGWRQCALAFLEAQSWRELLGVAAKVRTAAALVHDDSPGAKGAAGSMPVAAAALASPAAEESAARSADVRPAEPRSGRSGRGFSRQWLWVLEVAASFLVVFSLGWYIRGGLVTTTANSPQGIVARSADGSNLPTLQVVSEGAGKIQQPRPAAVLPDEARQLMERSGWQIRRERKYFPVLLPNGQRALVPFDQIELVPAGNRVMP